MSLKIKNKTLFVKQGSWVILISVVLLLLFLGIRYRNNSNIQQVNIEILEDEAKNKFIDKLDVKQILFKKFNAGIDSKSIGDIDVLQLERTLEENAYIKDANVYVDAQNHLNISILQRKPILRILSSKENGDYYLDEEGVKIPVTEKYTARVVVVTGDIDMYTPNFQTIEISRLRKVFLLIKQIKSDVFWNAQIEQIDLDHKGEAILIPKIGKQKIYFGAINKDVDDKLQRLITFYKEALPRKGWNTYKSINLAYKQQVVGKKK